MNKRESLPIKWRPKTFEEMIGNEGAIESISSLLKRPIEKIPASWLLIGPPGCGKTTIARIMQDYLDCDPLDFSEYNASNTRGIDFIRKVQEDSGRYAFKPGGTKVFLFDECHRLTPDAQNALLKLLEDAPEKTFFILATTNPEKLISAIHSRCTKISVQRVNILKMNAFLKDIAYQEGIEDIPDDVFKAIAQKSGGSPRDALKLLDMVLDMDDFDQMHEVLTEGIVDEQTLYDFCKMLLDPKEKWETICGQLKRMKESDSDGTRRGILATLHGFLLNAKGDQERRKISAVMDCFSHNYYDTGFSGLVLSCSETREI